MLIEYCDKCGMRVPEKDIQEGRAVRMDERLYCLKCCPAPATKAMSPNRHTSEAKIVLAPTRPQQQPASDGAMKAHARGARAHEPRSARTLATRQEGLSKPMLAGILAAVAGVLLLAVIFMSGGKSEQAHGTKADAPDLPRAADHPDAAPSAVKTAATRKPDPPRTADVVPPSGTEPSPAEADREDQAEKAYAALLNEAADQDGDARKTKLKEFIDTYSDTIVAARARVELARLESPQPDPAQPVAPAAVAPPPGGTTYVLQQGLDGYAGCADTTLSAVVPSAAFGGRDFILLNIKQVPLIRFAVFQSEGGPLPDGVRIVSAKLAVYRTYGDQVRVGAHAVLRPWSEVEANWSECSAGQAWGAEGCAKEGVDRSADSVDQINLEKDKPWAEFDVTAFFQDLGRRKDNYGWFLRPDRYLVNMPTFNSKEYDKDVSLRPKLTVVVAGDAKTAGAAGVPTDGLVLYLPFDDRKGNVVKDASGANNNAQLDGVPEWANGKSGGALHLNGRDSRVVLSRLAVNTQPGAKNTVAMWVRFGEFKNMLFSWAGRGSLYFGPNCFGFNTQSSDILGVPCSELALHQWIHVAAVFPNDVPSEQNATLYLNGKRMAIAQRTGRLPGGPSLATSDATIGALHQQGWYGIDATIEDFRIYNRELNEAEVAALYAAGGKTSAQSATQAPAAAPPPAEGGGLVLHLPFKKSGAEFTQDVSGKGCKVELKNGAESLASGRGWALNFPRGQAYAEVEGVAVDTRPGAKNTVTFWMYARDIQNAMPFAWKERAYCLYFYTGRFGFNTGEAGNILGVDGSRIKLRDWVHVAAVFPNGVPAPDNVALYLNGEPVQAKLVNAALPTKSVSASNGVCLGGIPNGNYYFNGLLQDVHIFNRGLSAGEVQAVFKNQPMPSRSADEIGAQVQGEAAPAADTAAAPRLGAEDKALDERLRRWRVLWGAGETQSLRNDIEALRKEGGAVAEQTAVAEAALAARDAAWKQAAMLKGKAGLRLALANGETQTGKIERLDGERFEFNLGGLVTRYQLGDLAWETFRGWAETQMTGDAEKQKKLTAAALLTAGVDAEKEADAALRTAWVPLFASAGRVDADQKNDAVWAEILGLVKAQKWQEVYGKVQGLLNGPPGGRLSAELQEKVEKLLAESKASIQAELSKPENLPLQVRARPLGDGKVELRYDFTNPRQLQDFEGMDTNFVRIEGGVLNLGALSIRHKLNFAGDLTIAYEAASSAAKPHRLCLNFYGIRGEIGHEGKEETNFWSGTNQPGNKTVNSNPLVGKQWNRIEIQFTAATKQTRIAVNGAELLTTTSPQAPDRGSVSLACYMPFLIRNLTLVGKPAPNAAEIILRNQASSETLQKELAQGESVKIFSEEDERVWNPTTQGNWRMENGAACGEGYIVLPGLALRDYEAEMDVHLSSAKKFRLFVRHGPKDRTHILQTEQGFSTYITERLASDGKMVGKVIPLDSKAWHHLTIHSKGSALKVVVDGKEVLVDEQQFGTDSLGFFFQAEGGKAALRNITVKSLR